MEILIDPSFLLLLGRLDGWMDGWVGRTAASVGSEKRNVCKRMAMAQHESGPENFGVLVFVMM